MDVEDLRLVRRALDGSGGPNMWVKSFRGMWKA